MAQLLPVAADGGASLGRVSFVRWYIEWMLVHTLCIILYVFSVELVMMGSHQLLPAQTAIQP